MTYSVDEATGGPYTHEIDAIRDERHRAAVMNVKPDFNNVFEGATISTGAAALLKDIDTPVDAPVGAFVQNVIFHDEEESSPEAGTEESTPEADKAEQGADAPIESQSEQPVGEVAPVVSSESETPLFDAVIQQDGAV